MIHKFLRALILFALVSVGAAQAGKVHDVYAFVNSSGYSVLRGDWRNTGSFTTSVDNVERTNVEVEKGSASTGPLIYAFVGHSLTDPIPMPFSQFIVPPREAYNLPGSVVFLQSIPGAPLLANWEHAETVPAFNAKAYVETNHVDHLILTENNTIWPEYTPEAFLLWHAQAVLGNPNVQTWWYQTWPNVPDDTDIEAWIALADDFWKPLYPEQLQYLRDEIGGTHYPRLIPGGEALSALVKAVKVDDIRDISEPLDLFSDGVHLSDIGAYFITMVHWATVHQHTPVGLPWNISKSHWSHEPFEGLTAEMAADLQAFAWEVVSHHPYAGIAEWP